MLGVPGQSRQSSHNVNNSQGHDYSNIVTIKEAIEQFIAVLIVKNICKNEDLGIQTVLECLGTENVMKVLTNKKVKKPQIVATLGFFNNKGLEEASEEFKHVKVEELKQKLISEFRRISPDKCISCKKIYTGWENETGAECILCRKKLCPDCCPKVLEEDQFMTTLFLIFDPISTDTHTNQQNSIYLLVHIDINTSVRFLSITKGM